MLTVSLHNIQCTAFHGVYAEEQKIGGKFIVDVEVDLFHNHIIKNIQETINYEILYEIIMQYMKKPQLLLETVVQELAHHILNHFTPAKSIRIQLKKLSPPIAYLSGSVAIRYQINR